MNRITAIYKRHAQRMCATVLLIGINFLVMNISIYALESINDEVNSLPFY